MHDQIHKEARHVGSLEFQTGDDNGGTFPRQKILVVMHDVVSNMFQECRDCGHVLVCPPQGFITAFQDIRGQLAVQMALLMLGFLLKAVDADMELADFPLERLASFVQVSLVFFGHCLDVGLRHGMAVFERCNPETDRGFLKAESLCSAAFR